MSRLFAPQPALTQNPFYCQPHLYPVTFLVTQYIGQNSFKYEIRLLPSSNHCTSFLVTGDMRSNH